MRLLFDVLVFVVIAVVGLYVYVEYKDDIHQFIFGQDSAHTLFVGNVPVIVKVADTKETMTRGLSGVRELGRNEGMLFIFPQAGKHGIWMKDMYIPLDIIWINEKLEVVHIEKQVGPETFPTVFTPPDDARFVLEVNAFFSDTLRLAVGDKVTIPPELLPADVASRLYE